MKRSSAVVVVLLAVLFGGCKSAQQQVTNSYGNIPGSQVFK